MPSAAIIRTPNGDVMGVVSVDAATGLPAAGGGGGGVQQTPLYTVATGVGTVAAGATSVNVANNGAVNGTWLGSVIEPGVSLPFIAAGSNTLAAFPYIATGTKLLIVEVR